MRMALTIYRGELAAAHAGRKWITSTDTQGRVQTVSGCRLAGEPAQARIVLDCDDDDAGRAALQLALAYFIEALQKAPAVKAK